MLQRAQTCHAAISCLATPDSRSLFRIHAFTVRSTGVVWWREAKHRRFRLLGSARHGTARLTTQRLKLTAQQQRHGDHILSQPAATQPPLLQCHAAHSALAILHCSRSLSVSASPFEQRLVVFSWTDMRGAARRRGLLNFDFSSTIRPLSHCAMPQEKSEFRMGEASNTE